MKRMPLSPSSATRLWGGILILVAAAAASRAEASQVVTLTSGNTLEVSSYRMEGRLIVFSLQGGGEIGFPAPQIVRIEERAAVPVPPPSVAAPAAPTPAPLPQAPEKPRVSPWDPEPGVRALIQEIASSMAMDPKLVEALVRVESNYDPYAVSGKGAMGLMQLMPETAKRYQVGNVFDPAQNIEGGTRHLKQLLTRYGGEVRLALAAYNAGEEAVDRYRGVPPFRETRTYVGRILRLLQP